MSWDIEGQRVADHELEGRFIAEERVAQYVADLTGNDLVSFGYYSVVDRLLVMDGLASAWLEVKTRTTERTRYSTYRISREKLHALQLLAEDTQLTTLIVVEWSCGSIGSANALDPEWRFGKSWAELPLERFRPLRRPE